MNKVFEYEIRDLHPVAVHFPVALVVMATLVVAIWLFRDQINWLSAAILVQAAAFAGGLVAFLSGDGMKEGTDGVPVVDALVEYHEEAAEFGVWLVGISLLCMIGVRWYFQRQTIRSGVPRGIRIVVFAAVVAAAVVISWTGHIGGIMAWGTSR